MEHQSERAWQKQAGVQQGFHARKARKTPGKAGVRYHKSVGLGFKTPREAIEGGLPPRRRSPDPARKPPPSGDAAVRCYACVRVTARRRRGC